MLSIANISSKHASNYYTTGDYYGNKDVRPEWFGKGAEKLKLLGKEFDKADFKNILNGKTILDGEEISLCNNRKEHASGIDLTFSAPKSVSVVCELKDKKIQELHEIAVKNTLEYIEKDFIYRRTKNEDGKFVKRMDNMIATLFTENTSRALDPQLHTHCVVYNITFDENDKAGSAFFKDIFNNKKFLGFIYRNELANQLRKEGYEIEKIYDTKNEILIKNTDDKKEIIINIDKARNFDVFRIKDLPLQKGDQLKWTKDFKELGIAKSDAIELTSITETSLTFKDKNTQKEIYFTKNDPKLKYLDYNYTTTTYSAQGMTSKNVIVPIESYRTNLTNQKSFYVELLRAKDNITLIVDNKDRVIEQLLNKTGENVNALEIFDKTRTNDSLNRKMGLNNKINKTIEPIKTISNDSYISKHIQNEIEFDK